jgi:macrolide transport system ATP-binding/permease protein
MQWFRNKNRSTPEDLAEEMAQHLEEKIETLIESGMSRQEAAAKARRAFGNQALLQDRSDAIWEGRYLAPILSDFNFAWRQLRHAPFFTTAAVLILGMGIAANTAVFSLLYAITQRDLPVSRPAELATVDLENPAVNQGTYSITYPMYEQLLQRQQSFSGMAVWRYSSATILDAYGDLRSRNTLLVTGNFFEELGVRPTLGRMLTEADDMHLHPNAAWPVVLGYDFWKENFHGDRGIVGRTITMSQGPAVVVGVAAPSFEGMLLVYPPAAYLPLHYLANHNDTYRTAPLSNLDPLHNSIYRRHLPF